MIEVVVAMRAFLVLVDLEASFISRFSGVLMMSYEFIGIPVYFFNKLA